MSTPAARGQPKRNRRRFAVAGAVVLAALLVFVLVYFQPQKLFIDDKVEEAAPSGAVPLVIAEEPAPTALPPATEPPTTLPADVESTGPVATEAPTPPPATAAPAAAVPVAATFISLDHGTSGNVLFLQDPATGDRFLRFEGLDTDNGPDLKVYLSTNPATGPEGAFDDDFVDLGRLQGNQGDQNYLIPADTDLTRFASVVIWCDRFDSAFGAADLSA